MRITEEHLERGHVVQDAAQDIVNFAKVVLVSRGIDSAASVVGTLLAAAWLEHLHIAPHDPEAFSELIRSTADSIDQISRTH
jgi:hypothetical protein